MDAVEDRCGVLEVVEGGQSSGGDEVLEEVLVERVSRDAGGDDHAGLASGIGEGAEQLGEQRVGVEPAEAGQWKPLGGVGVVLGPVVSTLLFPEGCVKWRVVSGKCLDEAVLRRLVRGVGNLGRPRRKELTRIELDLIPWWVA